MDERLNGCVLKRLTPIIAPEWAGKGKRGRAIEGRQSKVMGGRSRGGGGELGANGYGAAIFGMWPLNKTQLPN